MVSVYITLYGLHESEDDVYREVLGILSYPGCFLLKQDGQGDIESGLWHELS